MKSILLSALALTAMTSLALADTSKPIDTGNATTVTTAAPAKKAPVKLSADKMDKVTAGHADVFLIVCIATPAGLRNPHCF